MDIMAEEIALAAPTMAIVISVFIAGHHLSQSGKIIPRQEIKVNGMTTR